MLLDLEMIVGSLANNKLKDYWMGFEPVAFAFYNKEQVYLYNHPKYKTREQNYHLLHWNDQFMGDTLILFEDYPTAIVDLDLHEELEDLYSILVHELFHGYQFLKGDERYPDEMLIVTYPLSLSNIELRNQERHHLYQSVMAFTAEERRASLDRFIAVRAQRESLFGEFVYNEYLIETMEGPAWYVEFNAYAKKSTLPNDTVLHKYGAYLINDNESNLHIRSSCYSSGLFICLLMDEISSEWQADFMESDLTLYAFFKQFMDKEIMPLEEVIISENTEAIMDMVITAREKAFLEFNNQIGYHLCIEGNILTTSFNPMGIVGGEDRLLHKRFLKIMINDVEYFIQQPVISYYNDKIQNINKLHLIVDEQPIYNKGVLTLDGIGEIEGRYQETEEGFLLQC